MILRCPYCDREIADGPMVLAKEPHRAANPAHEKCGEKAKADRPRVELTKKVNRAGVIVDPRLIS